MCDPAALGVRPPAGPPPQQPPAISPEVAAALLLQFPAGAAGGQHAAAPPRAQQQPAPGQGARPAGRPPPVDSALSPRTKATAEALPRSPHSERVPADWAEHAQRLSAAAAGGGPRPLAAALRLASGDAPRGLPPRGEWDAAACAAAVGSACGSADLAGALATLAAGPRRLAGAALCRALLRSAEGCPAAAPGALLAAVRCLRCAPPVGTQGALADPFAVGDVVEAVGLTGAAALNGLTGTVRVPEADGGRVGVDFGPPFGAKALRPANLRDPDGAAWAAELQLGPDCGPGAEWAAVEEAAAPLLRAVCRAAAAGAAADEAVRAVREALDCGAARPQLLRADGVLPAVAAAAAAGSALGEPAAACCAAAAADGATPQGLGLGAADAAVLLQGASAAERRLGAWAARAHVDAGGGGELGAALRRAAAQLPADEERGGEALADALPSCLSAAVRPLGCGQPLWAGAEGAAPAPDSPAVQLVAGGGCLAPLGRAAFAPLARCCSSQRAIGPDCFSALHSAAARAFVHLLRAELRSAPGSAEERGAAAGVVASAAAAAASAGAQCAELLGGRHSRVAVEALFDAAAELLAAGALVPEGEPGEGCCLPTAGGVALATLAWSALPCGGDLQGKGTGSGTLSRAAGGLLSECPQQWREASGAGSAVDVIRRAADSVGRFQSQVPLCRAAALRLAAACPAPADGAPEAWERLAACCLAPALRRLLQVPGAACAAGGGEGEGGDGEAEGGEADAADEGKGAAKGAKKKKKKKGQSGGGAATAVADEVSARLLLGLASSAFRGPAAACALVSGWCADVHAPEMLAAFAAAEPANPAAGALLRLLGDGLAAAPPAARRVCEALVSCGEDAWRPALPRLLCQAVSSGGGGCLPAALRLLWRVIAECGEEVLGQWPAGALGELPLRELVRSCAAVAKGPPNGLGAGGALDAAAGAAALCATALGAQGPGQLDGADLGDAVAVLLAAAAAGPAHCGWRAAAAAASAEPRLCAEPQLTHAAAACAALPDPAHGAPSKRAHQLWALELCYGAVRGGGPAGELLAPLAGEAAALFAGGKYEGGKLPPPFTPARVRELLVGVAAGLVRAGAAVELGDGKVLKRMPAALKEDAAGRGDALSVAAELARRCGGRDLARLSDAALAPALRVLLSPEAQPPPGAAASAELRDALAVVCGVARAKGALAALEPRPVILQRLEALQERLRGEAHGGAQLADAAGELAGALRREEEEQRARRQAEEEERLGALARQMEAEEAQRKVREEQARAEREAREERERREQAQQEEIRRKLDRERREREKEERRRRQEEEAARRKREREAEELYRREEADRARREEERRDRERVMALERDTIASLHAMGVSQSRAIAAMRGCQGYDIDQLLEWLMDERQDDGGSAPAPDAVEKLVVLGSGAVRAVTSGDKQELISHFQHNQVQDEQRRSAALAMLKGEQQQQQQQQCDDDERIQGLADAVEEDDYEDFWGFDVDVSKNRRVLEAGADEDEAPENAAADSQTAGLPPGGGAPPKRPKTERQLERERRHASHPHRELRETLTPWHRQFARLLDLFDLRNAREKLRYGDIKYFVQEDMGNKGWTRLGYKNLRHWLNHAKAKGLTEQGGAVCSGFEWVRLTPFAVRYHKRYWHESTCVHVRKPLEEQRKQQRKEELARKRREALEALLSWKESDAGHEEGEEEGGGEDEGEDEALQMPDWFEAEEEDADDSDAARRRAALAALSEEERAALAAERERRRRERWEALLEQKRAQGWRPRPQRKREKPKVAAAPAAPALSAAERSRLSREAAAREEQQRKEQRAAAEERQRRAEQLKRKADARHRQLTLWQRLRAVNRQQVALGLTAALLVFMTLVALQDAVAPHDYRHSR